MLYTINHRRPLSMHYDHYTPEDFLKDDDFIQWVKNPTDAQILFWENWLNAHPEKAEAVVKAKQIILSVRYKNHYQPTAMDVKAVWDNIQLGKDSATAQKQWFRLQPLSYPLRYAAALAMVSLLSLLVWDYTHRRETLSASKATNQSAGVEHKTAKGQKETFTLPDGSTVRLNSESRITYRRDFGHKNRNTVLEGEAFFDIAHDASRPFTIQTGTLTTTVVGTSFNINAYADRPQIRVAVRTGKVKVAVGAESKKPVTLVPDEMSVFEKKSGSLTSQAFDPVKEFGWASNTIVLQNAGFSEIKRVLEKEYAVTFVVEKGLNVKEDFSARFNDAPIRKVLDALNYTSRFQYKLVKDRIYVTKKEE